MRDILVLLDTSYSIGLSNFEKKIKPFLKKLGTELNVSPNGTHIKVLVFSSETKTKVLLDFGEDYQTEIDSLQWVSVRGDQTRTEIAFQRAGEVYAL